MVFRDPNKEKSATEWRAPSKGYSAACAFFTGAIAFMVPP